MWSKSIRALNKGTENFTMILLVIMVLLVFFQIVSRAMFSTSFSWTNELARYMMVWLAFLGGGIAFQHNAHIGIEAIVERFSVRWQKFIQLAVMVICISFFIILIVTGLEFTTSSMTQSSPALNIPMGLVYLALPISGILQILNVVDLNLNYFKSKETESER
ncbi:TRAP transporter small permease [Planococcus wigleyi]|uniref:TRAP transporter small permease n=1 Tax=Planococcus wigleyi TaxID=2762216 RepID=A0ABR8WD30_9BACL|nr:TRAP transporter small permease [Planococcus wigleyi]MBD8014616.1 TRAP transporter small permease [Planococcus wigleyi]